MNHKNLKQFYLRAAAFVLILAVVLALLVLGSAGSFSHLIARYTGSMDYIAEYTGAAEIRPYIEKAQTEDGTTTAILGDSVCHQMFSGLQEDNHDFAMLGSNAGITMAGQYILAREYLDHHPKATDLYLMVLPSSLERTFDANLGYQYAVMPFAQTNTLNDLDPDTIQILRETYGSLFILPKVTWAMDRSGMLSKLYLNYMDQHTEGYRPDNKLELAEHYVLKIRDLCQERGVEFHFCPDPVSEASLEAVMGEVERMEESALSPLMEEYTKMLITYPENQSEDQIHFAGDFANQSAYNDKIRTEYAGTELLEQLILKD